MTPATAFFLFCISVQVFLGSVSFSSYGLNLSLKYRVKKPTLSQGYIT